MGSLKKVQTESSKAGGKKAIKQLAGIYCMYICVDFTRYGRYCTYLAEEENYHENWRHSTLVKIYSQRIEQWLLVLTSCMPYYSKGLRILLQKKGYLNNLKKHGFGF